MPYKKKYRKKRSARRRKYRRKATPSAAHGPLANKLTSTLRYYEDSFLDPGLTGVPAAYVFSANGVYDPNITSTGHQPRGFDQLAALYDHAVVIGSKLRVTLTNQDTVNAVNVAILLKDNSSPFSSAGDIMEYRFVKHISLPPAGSGRNTTTATLSCNPNKFLGRSKPMSDPDLKNFISSNPTEQCFFHIYAFPTGAAVNNDVVLLNSSLTYKTVWIEPKQPAFS